MSSIWNQDVRNLGAPTDRPRSPGRWVVRTSSGERDFATFSDLLPSLAAGEFPDAAYVYHPTAEAWVTVERAREFVVCTRCGHIGTPDSQSPMNGCVALVLLLLLIIPGVIYIAWGLTTQRLVCRGCGGVDTVVPVTSPGAFKQAATSPPVATPPVGFCSSCGKYFQGTPSFCPNCGAKV